MSKGKKIIGIVIILASVLGLISWEKWGKDRFMYEEIAVFTSDIPKGVVISEDMFTKITWPKGDEEALSLNEAKELVGLITKQNIKSHVPIYAEYFEVNYLMPSSGEDKYVLQIPEAWIDSCPEKIKRGDRVFIFSKGEYITDAFVNEEKNEEGAFTVIAGKAQIESLSKLIYTGGKLVISYDEGV